jgi:hypothetical protein
MKEPADPTLEEEAVRAKRALADGKPKRAVYHLAAALEGAPGRRDWLALLDQAIAAARDPLQLLPTESKAERWYKEALQRDPQQPWARPSYFARGTCRTRTRWSAASSSSLPCRRRSGPRSRSGGASWKAAVSCRLRPGSGR